MKICILAGEKSGDNYGSLLCRNFKELKPDIFIFGTGGERMEKEGVNLIKGMPFGQMGFSGVIKKIFSYISFLKKIIKEIERQNPDIIIFIDNPGFNLEIAKRLKKKFKTFYYIPPKIWAHNYKRIKILKKYVDFVIPIFPFECEIYKKENIPYFYFGHPFVDLIKEKDIQETTVKNKKIKIGICPGSRKEEIIYNLPIIKKIVEDLNKKINLEVLISLSDESFRRDIEKILKGTDFLYKITDQLYWLIENSDVICAVSGTVNLEVAYFEKPIIVFYKTSFFNYLFAKLVVKLNIISPVNIILGEKIVPEYIQNFKIEEAEKDIIDLIERKDLYNKEIIGFKKMKDMLKEKNVSRAIAEFIIKGVKIC
ncbi:MAG: lipid-A-disaccharide synthase [Candidatus Omnitrophica bacterium]|nr:lipid-A-disaccharide synthase [Candidatus Omnitrophota bacterium]